MANCLGQVPEDEQQCSECQATGLTQTRDGDLLCTECGTILKGRCFDTALETRQFDDDEEAVRVERVGTLGDPNALASTGMSRLPAGKGKANVGALNRAAQYAADKKETRNLENNGKLKDLTARIGASDSTHREAWEIFYQYEQKQDFKEVEEVMLACLYIACRNEKGQATRQLKELSRAASKTITPAQIHERVESIKAATGVRVDAGTVGAENFTRRFGASLGLSHQAKQLSSDIAHLMSSHSVLEGKNPKTNASLALWMACRILGLDTKLNDIANACGAAATTMRKNWIELYPDREKIVPPPHEAAGAALPQRLN